jgi:hypothetical protein
MKDSTPTNRPTRSPYRSLGCRALVFTTTVALGLGMGLVAVPGAAEAAASHAAPPATCSISAASVAAIVGHSVPAGTVFDSSVKATKANDGISAVVKSCIFGSETSLVALSHDVIVASEVTSRPLEGSELQHALVQAQALKFTFTAYHGLGMKAFYYTFTMPGTTKKGIPVQGMAAINGTKIYSAGLYTGTPEVSELAALVRLAEKL